MAKIRLPGRPEPKGQDIPFLGPYAQNQALAELAYQQALAQIEGNRGQLLQQFGYRPTENGMEVDPYNQYGSLQQMLRTNQQEADSVSESLRERGFRGAGFAAQGERDAQMVAGGRAAQLAQSLLQGTSGLAQQKMAAQFDFGQHSLENKLGSAEYAIQNNMFRPHDNLRTDDQAGDLVDRMRQQWIRRYGGAGSRKRNKAGLTFQQRVDKLGSSLYNRNANMRVGGRTF